MMNSKIVTLKQSQDLILELPEGFASPGEKVSIEQVENGLRISKLIPIEVDLDDDVFLQIAKMAHEKDITFNEMCIDILEEQMKRYKGQQDVE